MRGKYHVNGRAVDTAPEEWTRKCQLRSGFCIWLASDDASREDPANAAIPQYPALLFYDDAPYESDGEGVVCRYRRAPG